VDDPQVGLLDRLAVVVLRWQYTVQLPVDVNDPGARCLDEEVAGPFGQESPQDIEAIGPVDVDPQPASTRDRVPAAARRASFRDADEDLISRSSSNRIRANPPETIARAWSSSRASQRRSPLAPPGR
jgi:hypothetical protein